MAEPQIRAWKSTLQVWSPQDLPLEDRELLNKAHEAAANAYAPYSQFHVGGAVRLEDGTVVLGSNQENMAYPSGMCGERVAVFAAGAQHPGAVMTAVAIVSPSANAISDAFMPCGRMSSSLGGSRTPSGPSHEGAAAGQRRSRHDFRKCRQPHAFRF